MSFFHLKLSIPHLPCNFVSNTLLWPTLSYVLEYTNLQPNVQWSNLHTPIMKNICPLYASVSTFPRLDDVGALQTSVDVREITGSSPQLHSIIRLDSAEKKTLDVKIQLDGYHDSAESIRDQPKRRRKRKRRHGNSGSIPWNKGRKHTAETRALIKQRTIEALKNPQARKKMSEIPHSHSEASKAKISSSLRRVWGKRLKWKRLKVKFFLSWAESIARAAKEGSIDQQELNWDDYDKLKDEITVGKRAVEGKAEHVARIAQKREGRKEKENAKEKAKRKARRNSKKKAEESFTAPKLTLKQRLTKIRKKKSVKNQMISQQASLISHSPAWGRLNIELLKRQKVQREVSLADQIQAAKNKRTKSMYSEGLTEPIQ